MAERTRSTAEFLRQETLGVILPEIWPDLNPHRLGLHARACVQEVNT